MNQEPIFLIGAHKSGTSLLRSLFDGHSDLFVIPIESHFFQHLGYWIDYSLRRQFANDFTIKDLSQNLIDWIVKSNRISDRYADGDTRGYWDVARFEEVLKSKLGHKAIDTGTISGEKRLIEAYVLAMYQSLYHQDLPDEKRILEKSVENAEFALELKNAYPKAKFIHIVRNPYANMVSIRKYRAGNKGFPFLKKIMQALYNSYYYLGKNKRLIGEDYLVMKYEDLLQHPEVTINKLVDFTGISNKKTLYTPTAFGKPWGGNSTTNQEFNGITPKTLDKWKEDISPLEVNVVNRWFDSELRHFGYRVLENQSVWAPVKNENFKTYVQNRLLLRIFM